ncbi:membrane bound O-acyl transferase family-domain-containing protein [Rostrohypoxylon terebratum]|nr:membrane bound O-acyl transferase family-domain-containing protein [Rostrohypoxylon terebratum]
MDHQSANLATTYREFYRAKLQDDVKAGTRTLFLVPFHFLGFWIIPTLYLAIPHRNRPWLYHARWLVLAFVVVFNFNIILNVSSTDFGIAYGAGLIGAWGIIWNWTLLVWTRPQWEAKRVNVRRKRRQEVVEDNLKNDKISTSEQNGNHAKENSGEKPKATGLELSGHLNGGHGQLHDTKERRTYADALEASSSPRQNESDVQPSDKFNKQEAEQEFEYYWQEYPEDASFWARLDWAFDIVSTFRLTGWNWAISSLPPYEPPPKVGDHQLPLSSVGPQRTKEGYTRHLTRRELFLDKLLYHILPNYLIADFCAVTMTLDPYFVLGPERAAAVPLPPHLASLTPPQLFVLRAFAAFTGILSVIHLFFNAGQLALLFLPPFPQLLRFRAHPWHLPSVTGSFTQVLDRGLAGFWGAWWHQTFRYGFFAPTQYLLRHSSIRPRTPAANLAAVFFAFLLSGLLHASGSYSAMPAHSRWYQPLVFFLLAGAGTMLQSHLSRVLSGYIRKQPRWARRAGNLAFATAWMVGTSWVLVDDFGRCGLWLFEPVPFSVFRALGWGAAGDTKAWRVDGRYAPRWYVGERWWQVGFAI